MIGIKRQREWMNVSKRQQEWKSGSKRQREWMNGRKHDLMNGSKRQREWMNIVRGNKNEKVVVRMVEKATRMNEWY